MRYVATFHTHLSAMLSCQALNEAGAAARMMPVPRKLSSSCGTCVRYESEEAHADLLDHDREALYLEENGGYTPLTAAL